MAHRKWLSVVPAAALLFALLAVAAATAPAAKKRIIPTPNRGAEETRAAKRLANAIVVNRRHVRGAAFSTLPPFSDPAAVSTKRLAGFPRHGDSFAILANGDAKAADNRNSTGSYGSEIGGPSVRGSRDVTIFRIALRVPRRATCLSIRFRFLSEEFPEYVDWPYNDAFIAELDESTWNTVSKEDPRIVAPRNFAADTRGNPIAVNAVGDASVAPNRAGKTTYDAATRILRASTRVRRARHILYLSLFDQGDRIYDSAVFLDRLTLDRRRPCRSGAVVD